MCATWQQAIIILIFNVFYDLPAEEWALFAFWSSTWLYFSKIMFFLRIKLSQMCFTDY